MARAVSWLIALGIAALAGTAAAQPRWVVVAVTSGAGPFPAGAAEQLAAEPAIRDRALPATVAADLVQREHGAPAFSGTIEDVEELERCARDMRLSLAQGRSRAAGAQLGECEELIERVRASYLAESQTETQVFHACLAVTEVLRAAGRRAEARERLVACRLGAPQAEPNPTLVPPELRDLLAEVDRYLRALPPARLRVQLAQAEDCRVRVRGQTMGRAPIDIPGLLPGEALIQLLCESRPIGRVHRLELEPGDNEIVIDPRFDEALLEMGDTIRLAYPWASVEEAHRIDDALNLARALRVDVIVLVSSMPGSRLRFDRLEIVDGQVVASVVVRCNGDVMRPVDRFAIAAAAEAIVRGQSLDLSGTQVVEIAPWRPGSR